MHKLPSANITEEQIREYERNGAICIRGMFNEDWVERMRAVLEQLKQDQMKTPEYNPGFITDRAISKKYPEIEICARESPAAAIAKKLMRANTVRFYFDHIFMKEPGTNDRSDWHMDQPFWPILGDQVCSVWLALDHINTENSGLEYVAGSHRWGFRYAPECVSGKFKSLDTDVKMANIDAERDKHEFLSWEMQPGDCLVHHSLTVHGASGNTHLARRRRAIAFRFAGDDAVYAPEAGSDERLIEPSLKSGAPLVAERFPIIECA